MNLGMKDVIIDFGNVRLTGKDCVVTDIEVHQERHTIPVHFMGGKTIMTQGAPQDVEITMSLLCRPDNYIMEYFDETYVPKIRNKKVEDCTINELLFAVRRKIGEKNNGKEDKRKDTKR